jgi:predicted transcriptional regulator
MKTTCSFTLDSELIGRLERSKKKKSALVNEALRQFFKLEAQDEKLETFSDDELKEIYEVTHARLVVIVAILDERKAKRDAEAQAEAESELAKHRAATRFWGGEPPKTIEEAKQRLAEQQQP